MLYLAYDYRKGKLFLLTGTWQKIKALPFASKLLIGGIIWVTALYTLLPPLSYDTALYHWQSMMWTETYPAVPGLANLHTRFGFDSNALLLHTAFSLQDVFGFHVIGINGLSLLVLFIWIIFKIRESSWVTRLALALFAIVFLRYYDTNIASPGTDLLPNILIAYLLLRAALDYRSMATAPLLYWVLPVFCLTLKLSTTPFCLFSVITFTILVFINKQYKTIFPFVITGCILLIPWFVRNVILSGYLIYPYPSIDWFSVDWKVPLATAEGENMVIRSFARVLDSDYQKVMELPLTVWGKMWLVRYFNISKMVILLLSLAVISPFVVAFTQKKTLIKSPCKITAWLIAFIGMIFWAVMAPDVRFAFSSIAGSALIPFILININIKNAFLNKLPVIAGFLGILFFTGVCFNVIRITKNDLSYSAFLYKPNVVHFTNTAASIEFKTSELGNNVILYMPQSGDQCYDHSFPCAPDYCSDCLEMRGKSLREGFRMKK
ncbi:membrane protein [Bacteroidia bacterium]|nr:membrane protein [Bacteroidia bacterium]GHV70558.1 membrane protein [Bacteroidia bacterium]